MTTRARNYKAEYAARKARAATLGRRRDYRAEYQDRLRRGAAAGLERQAARGHPGFGQVGAAELRQLRRAAALASPGGWVEVGGVLTRGPPAGPDLHRQAAATRVAALAGAPDPVVMSGVWRKASVYGAEAFVREFMRLGLGSEQQAYTLWFSP